MDEQMSHSLHMPRDWALRSRRTRANPQRVRAELAGYGEAFANAFDRLSPREQRDILLAVTAYTRVNNLGIKSACELVLALALRLAQSRPPQRTPPNTNQHYQEVNQ